MKDINILDAYGNRYFNQEAMEKLFNASLASLEINNRFKKLRKVKSILKYCSIIVDEQIAAGLNAAIVLLEEPEATSKNLVESIRNCNFKIQTRILIFTECGMIDLIFMPKNQRH